LTWPPPRPPEPEVPHRPWDPGVAHAPGLMDEHTRLVYVVVDEMIGGWAGLSFSAWPHADPDGRLRFVDIEGPVEVGTSRKALLKFLATGEHIDPETGIRIGDTFTARTRKGTAAKLLDSLRARAGHGEVRVPDLGDLLKNPVDLSEQGRLLAKLASFGAMLSTVPEEVQARLQGEGKS
jgi:hypothetical protein